MDDGHVPLPCWWVRDTCENAYIWMHRAGGMLFPVPSGSIGEEKSYCYQHILITMGMVLLISVSGGFRISPIAVARSALP